MKCKKAKKKYPASACCATCQVVGTDTCPVFGSKGAAAPAIDKDLPRCDKCGSQKGKLTKIVRREQEYPGAMVWSYDYHYCSKCIKKQSVAPFTVQENTRGW